jgi:hypothetical protein
MYWFGWVHYINGIVLFLSYDLTKDNAQDIQISCFSLHSLSLQFYSSQSPTIFSFSFLSWQNKVIALTLCLSIFTSANYLQPDLLSLSLFSKMLQWGCLSNGSSLFLFYHLFVFSAQVECFSWSRWSSEWMRCLALTRYLSIFT